MPKCILCRSDHDVIQYPGFCLGCADRAIWEVDHLTDSRIKIPARKERIVAASSTGRRMLINPKTRKLEGHDVWGLLERLELAERAISSAGLRLGDLYEVDGDLPPPWHPSDSPVWLMLLAVTVSAEVAKLRTRVSDLAAEVEHLRGQQSSGAEDLARLVDRPKDDKDDGRSS